MPAATISQAEPETGLQAYFQTKLLVRFVGCDPAGMMFYPRCMEIFNNLEDWCIDGLRLSFSELPEQRRSGLPTVHLDADFIAPICFGAGLLATISHRDFRTSSISLAIDYYGPDGGERVHGKAVLVLIYLRSKQAVPIPGDIAARITSSSRSNS